jgi:hypothetical protein
MMLAVCALVSWSMLNVYRNQKHASIPFEVLSGEKQLCQNAALFRNLAVSVL